MVTVRNSASVSPSLHPIAVVDLQVQHPAFHRTADHAAPRGQDGAHKRPAFRHLALNDLGGHDQRRARRFRGCRSEGRRGHGQKPGEQHTRHRLSEQLFFHLRLEPSYDNLTNRQPLASNTRTCRRTRRPQVPSSITNGERGNLRRGTQIPQIELHKRIKWNRWTLGRLEEELEP